MNTFVSLVPVHYPKWNRAPAGTHVSIMIHCSLEDRWWLQKRHGWKTSSSNHWGKTAMILGVLPEIEIFWRDADGPPPGQEKSFHADRKAETPIRLYRATGCSIWSSSSSSAGRAARAIDKGARCSRVAAASARWQGRCHLLLPGFVFGTGRRTLARDMPPELAHLIAPHVSAYGQRDDGSRINSRGRKYFQMREFRSLSARL